MAGFELGSVTAKVDLDINDFKNGIKQVESGVENLSKKMDDFGSTLRNFGKKWSLFATAPILAAGTMALKTAADFEQLEVALSTILGSEEKAAELLKEMEAFAAKTPFEFTELAESTKQLLAYGFAQEEILDTSSMLGDVAAGLNIRFGDLAYLYGTLRAQQVAYTKDLNQFANRGIPIWEELSKVVGASVPEVRKLVEEGAIGFPVVEQAFRNMTGEGGKFHDLMQAQSETTAGQFSNLKDSIGFLSRDIGTLLLPYAIQLIEKFRDLVDWINGLTEEQKKLIVIIGAVVAGIGPLLIILGVLASGVSAVIAIIGGLGAAMTFLAANPIVILIAAVALLATLIVKNWDQIKAAFEIGKNFISNIMNNIVSFLGNVGKQVVSTLVSPFESAWNRIKDIMNKIKDALDFTKRHSPSVLDIVNKGVRLTNEALSKLEYSSNISPQITAAGITNKTTGPSIYNVNLDMEGAVIADEFGAERMGKLIGNSMINELKLNVRF